VRRRPIERGLAERVARPRDRQHRVADADTTPAHEQKPLDRCAAAEEGLSFDRGEESQQGGDRLDAGRAEVVEDRRRANGVESAGSVSAHALIVGSLRCGAKVAALCSRERRPHHRPSRMERTLDPARLGDHLDRLYRAAWAFTGSREDAEDLVQETYARVLARPRFLRNEDDLGYLLRALRNTFLTQKRTEGRRLRPDPLPDEHDLLADPHARRPENALEASELYSAVAALPDEFRDVLVAVDITGLSYKEAARALKIREGTVMSRLYRARQQVVRRIEGGAG
jgi:RNA polymerase sigma-70 factor, ECF subfamily